MKFSTQVYLSIVKKIGWIRLWIWGVCPECTHDAPKLYDCNICGYYEKLPRYRSEQNIIQKKKIWTKFLDNLERHKD